MTTNTNDMALCEELWNEYEPSLRKICNYRLSSNTSEIDDVIGEAYLALCNAINQGETINNPKAWLYSTVNNIIKLKYTEIKKHKKTLVNLDSVEHELFYNIDFDEAKLSDEIIDQIKDEIYDELLPAEQTLLILIYSRKHKFNDIAKILHTTKGAVKQRHYRLKRKIKSMAKEKIKKL